MSNKYHDHLNDTYNIGCYDFNYRHVYFDKQYRITDKLRVESFNFYAKLEYHPIRFQNLKIQSES
jgi:hypothetical protein